MKLVRARSAGFCLGVALALKKLESQIGADSSPIFTLGPIIHNPQVLAEYRQRGVEIAATPEDIPPGSRVVIRAHGIPREVQERLESRGVGIHDATCPKVKKAQLLIRKHTEKRPLLLYGEPNHPEVIGLISYAQGETFIFENIDDLDTLPLEDGRNYCLASQTTQDVEEFERIAREVKQRAGGRVKILETICRATMERQREAIEIAKSVDIMIVVGGQNSGNTRRLAQVVREQGTPCIHVETASELDAASLPRDGCMGLTAGASTPEKIIAEAQDFLEQI